MRKPRALRPRGSLPRPVHIVGNGAYLPQRVLTNAELETMVDTSDHWIVSRTGIRERRIAAPDEAVSDMGARAAERALADAGVSADEVGLIVVATLSPDMPFPNSGCLVQEQIGARHAFCFSLEGACSGFLYSVETARQFVLSGSVETALVIGAEKLSSFTDWEDRDTCVLFGDGAGAVVLQSGKRGAGLMASVMGGDGALGDLLRIPAGGSRRPASVETVQQRQHFIKMSGREVFKHAVTRMTAAAEEVLKECGMEAADVDCIIPHQANIRIIRAVGQRLGLPEERFYINVDRFGNTSAASIAIALDEAVRNGRIRQGDHVLMFAFGGGFTWGASLMEWDKQV